MRARIDIEFNYTDKSNAKVRTMNLVAVIQGNTAGEAVQNLADYLAGNRAGLKPGDRITITSPVHPEDANGGEW